MRGSTFQVALILLLAFCSACIATPTLVSVTPDADTTTPTTVVITGTGFDSITGAKVWISGIECQALSVASATTISCTAQPGLGVGNNLTLTYSTGSVSANIFNYKAATNVHVCSGAPLVIEPSKGQLTVTICGSNFGSPQDTADVAEWNGHLAISLPHSVVGNIIYHSDSQLIINVGENGVGSANAITVELGSQRVVVEGVLVKYENPLVDSITKKDDSSKRAASGIVLVWKGTGFGVPNSGVTLTATIGPYACTRVNHISPTQFECTALLGPGSNLPSFVVVSGQKNPPIGVGSAKYDVPAEDVVITLSGNAAAFASSCTAPHGSADSINSEVCNCWSSYVPSNELQTECFTQAKCAGRTISSDTVSASPSRPITKFVDDKLEIVQRIPIEKGRRDTNIQFMAPALPKVNMLPSVEPGTHGADTCFYPGTLWAKKVNDLDCLDEYYASIPWSQHALCGFVEQVGSVSPLRTFKTYMLTTSTYAYKAHDGVQKNRISQVGYLVTVTFVRQLKVFTSPINVVIADVEAPISLSVEVEGSIVYDVASKNTIISFGTTVVWPYKLKGPLPGDWRTETTETGNVASTITLESSPACTEEQDTDCEQSWVMTLATTDVCNLKGSVAINTNALDCRDYTSIAPCAGSPNTNFTIHIGYTNLCSNSEVDASKGIDATIQSYYDRDATIDQNVFQTGDMVYFVLTVVDPISTIDRVTFSDITLLKLNSLATDNLFHQANPGAALSTATVLAGTELNITQEVGDVFVSAGEKGQLAFNFRLLRNKLNVVQNLASPTEETSSIKVQVTLDVFYHGNEKRTVVATTSTPAMVEHQLSFYNADTTDDELVENKQDNLAEDAAFSMFEQSAATTSTCFSFAVAFCVFIAAIFA